MAYLQSPLKCKGAAPDRVRCPNTVLLTAARHAISFPVPGHSNSPARAPHSGPLASSASLHTRLRGGSAVQADASRNGAPFNPSNQDWAWQRTSVSWVWPRRAQGHAVRVFMRALASRSCMPMASSRRLRKQSSCLQSAAASGAGKPAAARRKGSGPSSGSFTSMNAEPEAN